MKKFHYLGKKVSTPSKQLDTFPKPVHVQTVKFESNELTSCCPVTQQPDFNTVTIEFAPDKLCIESKSLKLYLWSFREEPLFAEGLANVIAEDIFTAVSPFWCKITLVQNIRGGMQLSVIAERSR
jgi:7-cyano-7-deazaguanine reductase